MLVDSPSVYGIQKSCVQPRNRSSAASLDDSTEEAGESGESGHMGWEITCDRKATLVRFEGTTNGINYSSIFFGGGTILRGLVNWYVSK